MEKFIIVLELYILRMLFLESLLNSIFWIQLKLQVKRLAIPENQGCSERLMININNLIYEVNELTKLFNMLHGVKKEVQFETAAKGIIPQK